MKGHFAVCLIFFTILKNISIEGPIAHCSAQTYAYVVLLFAVFDILNATLLNLEFSLTTAIYCVIQKYCTFFLRKLR